MKNTVDMLGNTNPKSECDLSESMCIFFCCSFDKRESVKKIILVGPKKAKTKPKWWTTRTSKLMLALFNQLYFVAVVPQNFFSGMARWSH